MRTKKELMGELLAIQEHRRKTWTKEWGKPDTFVDFQNNAQYDRVSALIQMLSVMTEAEYTLLSKRADQAFKDNEAQQTSLF